MNYSLAIPLPTQFAERIETFRRDMAEWALRPQRSEPHISIKGPAGLDESPETFSTLTKIAISTAPFSVRLDQPAVFEGEPVLYLSVVSPGWERLNRRLIDTIAARTMAEMHPLEISGWIPHMTIFRLKPELLSRYDEILSTTSTALIPFLSFTAATLRMYRQKHHEGQWLPFQDIALSGRVQEDEYLTPGIL